MPEELEQPGSEEKPASLPLDPLGLGLRFLGRLPLLGLALGGSLALASVVGVQLGRRTYLAESLLLYKPNKASGDSLNVQTQMNLIKTRSNLEETRKRLNLKVSAEDLARDFEVKLQRNTDLLSLTARDSQAKMAADKVRTLRDVFLQHQDQARKDKLKNQLNDLEKRLDRVSRELKQTEQDLESFTLKHRIVDLDKEAQWYLEQLTNLQVLYEQAKVERSSVQLQAGNIDRIISDLKVKIEKEKQESSSMSNLGDINIQVQRLRDALHDDKQQRSGNALLRQKKLEYERALRLRDRGLISQAELDKDRAAYESQKALTVDTPQTQEWKEKIDALNAVAIPKSTAVTASGTVLQEMTLKSFDLQLNLVTQDQKVRRLMEAIATAQRRLDQIPKLQQKYAALSRDLQNKAAEKTNLETLVGDTRRAYEAQNTDFTVASEAVVPSQPFESSRKKLFMLAALGLGGASILAILGLCLWDRRILTPKELSLALDQAPALPAFANMNALDCTFLARQLRRQLHQPKACLAVVSALAGQGKTRLLQQLAQAWVEQGEQVAILDLSQASSSAGHLPSLSPKAPSNPWVISGTGTISPAHLSEAGDFGPWLSELQQWATLVLVEAPSADQGVLADLAGARCSHVLVVAAAGKSQAASVSALHKRLKAEGASHIQGVLTGLGNWLKRWSSP